VITFRALDIKRDWPIIRDKVQCVLCEDTRGVVAERDGKLAGAFIFDSWTPNSVQSHQLLLDPMALKAGLHREAANYVYGVAGRKLIIGLTPSDNAKALKLNKHYGFTEAYRLQDGVRDGVDYVVMVMHRDDCPYYEEKPDGVQQRSAA
jgi:hypothetical protein